MVTIEAMVRRGLKDGALTGVIEDTLELNRLVGDGAQERSAAQSKYIEKLAAGIAGKLLDYLEEHRKAWDPDFGKAKDIVIPVEGEDVITVSFRRSKTKEGAPRITLSVYRGDGAVYKETQALGEGIPLSEALCQAIRGWLRFEEVRQSPSKYRDEYGYSDTVEDSKQALIDYRKAVAKRFDLRKAIGEDGWTVMNEWLSSQSG